MQFMRANPDLQIDLGVDDRYVDLIEQGVDVAVRMGRLADSTLGARYLGMNPWVLVASPALVRERDAPATPRELAARDCLIYSTVQGDARWHFAGPGGQPESVAVRGPLRSNSLSILLEAAVGGMGVAALPRYVAHAALERGDVVPLLQAWSLPAQEIHAVYPSPRMVPLKVSGLVHSPSSRIVPRDRSWSRRIPAGRSVGRMRARSRSKDSTRPKRRRSSRDSWTSTISLPRCERRSRRGPRGIRCSARSSCAC